MDENNEVVNEPVVEDPILSSSTTRTSTQSDKPIRQLKTKDSSVKYFTKENQDVTKNKAGKTRRKSTTKALGDINVTVRSEALVNKDDKSSNKDNVTAGDKSDDIIVLGKDFKRFTINYTVLLYSYILVSFYNPQSLIEQLGFQHLKDTHFSKKYF